MQLDGLDGVETFARYDSETQYDSETLYFNPVITITYHSLQVWIKYDVGMGLLVVSVCPVLPGHFHPFVALALPSLHPSTFLGNVVF